MKLFEIYHHQGEDFFRFALSLTRHKEDAEDLVQQAYIKALNQLELFEVMEKAQIKGWFFTAIKNQFIDHYRRSKRFPKVPFNGQMMENYSDPAGEVSTERKVLEKLEAKEVLEKLPKELKTLVIYRYYLGYNTREISELFGINPSTLRSRYVKIQALLTKEKNS